MLRIGLSDSEGLKDGCVAGPYHPAMGELVMSRYIRNQLERFAEEGKLEIVAPKKHFSKIIGNKKCNQLYFAERGIALSLKEGKAILVNRKYSLEV